MKKFTIYETWIQEVVYTVEAETREEAKKLYLAGKAGEGTPGDSYPAGDFTIEDEAS